jgi:hypothetical protein
LDGLLFYPNSSSPAGKSLKQLALYRSKTTNKFLFRTDFFEEEEEEEDGNVTR